MKFNPYEKGGGKSLSHIEKGGRKKFPLLNKRGGGRKKFYPHLRGGGESKRFRTRDFPIL